MACSLEPAELPDEFRHRQTVPQARERRAHLARCHPSAGLEVFERPLVASPELRDLFEDWKRGHAERVLAGLGLQLLSGGYGGVRRGRATLEGSPLDDS